MNLNINTNVDAIRQAEQTTIQEIEASISNLERVAGEADQLSGRLLREQQNSEAKSNILDTIAEKVDAIRDYMGRAQRVIQQISMPRSPPVSQSLLRLDQCMEEVSRTLGRVSCKQGGCPTSKYEVEVKTQGQSPSSVLPRRPRPPPHEAPSQPVPQPVPALRSRQCPSLGCLLKTACVGLLVIAGGMLAAAKKYV